MPTYVYELESGDCRICGGTFEINRPVSRPKLTHCPICKMAVRQCVTHFQTPKITKPFSVSDAKKAGFTLLKKVDKGTFEKM